MPVSKTVDQGSNPCGPARVKAKSQDTCLGFLLLEPDLRQVRTRAGAAGMFWLFIKPKQPRRGREYLLE